MTVCARCCVERCGKACCWLRHAGVLRGASRKIAGGSQCHAPKEHIQKITSCRIRSLLNAFLLLSSLVRAVYSLVALSNCHNTSTSLQHCDGWRLSSPPRSSSPKKTTSPQTCQPNKREKYRETLESLITWCALHCKIITTRTSKEQELGLNT